MAPSRRRGPWDPKEDQMLLQIMSEHENNDWVRISQHMHNRSPKQCRERYHQNLKPSLNKNPISEFEGLVIEHMVNEIGKRWAVIARQLDNRSDNMVRNWWNSRMNRQRHDLSIVPVSHTHKRGLKSYAFMDEFWLVPRSRAAPTLVQGACTDGNPPTISVLHSPIHQSAGGDCVGFSLSRPI
ncbi:unnamed protein product [Penicillium palitans]